MRKLKRKKRLQKANRAAGGTETRWIRSERFASPDPLLALAGSGRGLWQGEHADAYIDRLRTDSDETA